MTTIARFSASSSPIARFASRTLAGVGLAIATLSISVTTAVASERYAAYVVDAETNEVLHADQAEESRFPASLTKMMTLYMLFDALERKELTLDSKLTASKFASLQAPTKLGLKRGDQISVDTAIKALVTKSANDVAVVVAERLGGSEARFASLMTARARELGMSSTRFVNASGLPNLQQRTSAKDMAVLGKALLRDFPQYYSYFKSPGMTWRARYARNHNGLLGQVEGMDGIKTGYTRMSGFNLTSSVERNGHRIIAVVMGGESASARDAQMAHLIEGAFEEIAKRTGQPLNSATFVSMPVNRVTLDFSRSADAEEGSAESAAPAGSVTLQTAPADRPTYTVPAPTAPHGGVGAAGTVGGAASAAAFSLISPLSDPLY